MLRQLINRHKIKLTKLGRIVRTGRVSGPNKTVRPDRKERTLRPRRKTRVMR